jgi:hypothetical protein
MTETIIRTVIRNNTNNFKIQNFLQSTMMYDSDECYISVEKFYAQRFGTDHNFILFELDGVENCYDNSQEIEKVCPSEIIDVFMGKPDAPIAGVNTMTFFNIINNTDNWTKINRSSLSNMNFNLYLDGINIAFNYYLILKIKYIKNKN